MSGARVFSNQLAPEDRAEMGSVIEDYRKELVQPRLMRGGRRWPAEAPVRHVH